jgi:hypothetical protein
MKLDQNSFGMIRDMVEIGSPPTSVVDLKALPFRDQENFGAAET